MGRNLWEEMKAYCEAQVTLLSECAYRTDDKKKKRSYKKGYAFFEGVLRKMRRFEEGSLYMPIYPPKTPRKERRRTI